MSSELILPPETTCWIVSDGKTGTENQCLGLAEALGLVPTVKRIKLRVPWRWLSPYVRGFERYAFSAAGDAVAPPFPDLLIASGRRALPASFYVKQASPRTFVVQLQDPHCSPVLFDMVAAPEHDLIDGPNVFKTLGALNRVTSQKIADTAAAWLPRFAHLPGPYISAMIGGPSMAYGFDDSSMHAVIAQLQAALDTTSCSLLITASRRTRPAHMAQLQAFAAACPQRVWLWDNAGENPYFALLGLARHIVVTADSASMISEAAGTGRPIHILPLPGGTPKFDRFYKALFDKGIARPFAAPLAEWGYDPIYESKRIAHIIADTLKRKQP